jgi:hypothetical protein
MTISLRDITKVYRIGEQEAPALRGAVSLLSDRVGLPHRSR